MEEEAATHRRHEEWRRILQQLTTLPKASASKAVVVLDMDECFVPSGQVWMTMLLGHSVVCKKLGIKRYMDTADVRAADLRAAKTFVAEAVGVAMHKIMCIRPGFAEFLKTLRKWDCKIVLCTSAPDEFGSVSAFVTALQTWFDTFPTTDTSDTPTPTPSTRVRVCDVETMAQITATTEPTRPLFDAVIALEQLKEWMEAEGSRDHQKNMKWLLKYMKWDEDSPVIVVEDNVCWVRETPFVLEVDHFRLLIDFNKLARAAGILSDTDPDSHGLILETKKNTTMRKIPYESWDRHEGDQTFVVMSKILDSVFSDWKGEREEEEERKREAGLGLGSEEVSTPSLI